MKPDEAIVHVVDDDEAVCRALCRLLKSVGLSAQAHASAQAFLEEHQPSQPGCLILDVRMPGLGGLEVQDILAARKITLPIIFITGHGDVPMSVRAMKNGAVDFIQKPFNDQVLLDAVQRCLLKDAEVRREQATRDAIQRQYQRLTPREQEVLQLVVAGRLNKQIAAELAASEKTIKVHRGRVMKKMEAESLADLVLKAETIGMARRSADTIGHAASAKSIDPARPTRGQAG